MRGAAKYADGQTITREETEGGRERERERERERYEVYGSNESERIQVGNLAKSQIGQLDMFLRSEASL